MLVRMVNLLVALVVVAQGGCLRACQLQELILGDNDDTSPSSVTTSTSSGQQTCTDSLVSKFASAEGSRTPSKSEACSCEYKKGLAQPERMDTGVAFDIAAPVWMLNTMGIFADRPAVRFVMPLPAPADSQYTPLLI